jgi:GNAT superfamily N-acetyltransferase/2'-5' RNA ligase
MQIQRVGACEWERLRVIRLAALADAPGAFSSTFEREAGWPRESWQAWAGSSEEGTRQRTFIADEAGAWLGIATGAVNHRRAGAVLYSMWVAPTARRRGIGRRLVEAVIDWARSRDLPAIWLWVTEGNHAADHLYRTHGFVRSGRDEDGAQELVLWLADRPTVSRAGPVADFLYGLCVILLPEPVNTLVGRLRQRFDPVSAAFVPPHITVSQPLAVPLVGARTRRLRHIAHEFAPFGVAYGPARTFPESIVDYLAVEPQSAILAIRNRLHETGWFRLDMPHTDDFVAHITIREHAGAVDNDPGGIHEAVDDAVKPGTFRCGALAVLAPGSTDRFRPIARFRLGPSHTP